ncbi:GNAT family N-acetyltransferase [Myxococcota bacterium]|nr:GNAT family N-acetyltransferase [Myxococcota bacterium]
MSVRATVSIRIAQPKDLTAIVHIYNLAIKRRGSTSDLTPLTVEDRRAWFDNHIAAELPVWVGTIGEEVVAWCSISAYFPGRKGLVQTREISFYVHEDHQRQGIGEQMVRHAIESGESLGIKTLFAILLDQNHGSVALLEKMGFRRWGHLPGVSLIDGEEFGHYYYGRRI